MTLSVPSALAAATSLDIPPPAAADVAFAQLNPPPLDDEDPEPHPAVSTRAATPASANRPRILTAASSCFPHLLARPRAAYKADAARRQRLIGTICMRSHSYR